MKNILVTAALGLIAHVSMAQDIHFARTKDMQKWYNSSLRNENDERTLTLNNRSVTYKQLIAFRSIAALADIPLISSATRESEEKKAYFSIAGGFAVDKSNQGVLNNSNALLGVSYNLPVNVSRSTFLSMGIQGSMFESRINMNGVTTPDQFNKYGMIPNSTPNDPSTAGKISFFSLNAGLSLSHSDQSKAWYVGASARHLNRPEANLKGSQEYKLPVTSGMQAGYKKIMGNDAVGLDVMMNFKANAYEHIATAHYSYTFDKKDFDGALGASLGYRYNDAIIPGLMMQFHKTILGFNYDMVVGRSKAPVSRVSYELGIRQLF